MNTTFSDTGSLCYTDITRGLALPGVALNTTIYPVRFVKYITYILKFYFVKVDMNEIIAIMDNVLYNYVNILFSTNLNTPFNNQFECNKAVTNILAKLHIC